MALRLIENTLAGMPAAWTASATLTQLRARIFDVVDVPEADEAERLLETLADMNVAGIELATIEAIIVGDDDGLYRSFARLLNDLFAQRHRHIVVHGLAQTAAARRTVAGIVEAAAEQGLRNILGRFAIALIAAPTSTQAEAAETLVAAFWRGAAAGHVAVIEWFMMVPEMPVFLLNPAAQPFWHVTAMSADTTVADMILDETRLGAAMRRSRATADLDAIIEGALSRRRTVRTWMTWLETRGMLRLGLAATGTYTSAEAMLAWAVNNGAVDAAMWLATEKFDTANRALEAVATMRIAGDDNDVARTLQRVVAAILRAPYANTLPSQQQQQQSRARVLAEMIAKSGAREDVKRKFEELAAFTEWRETPASLGHLGQLLVVLVGTGLMTEPEAMAINGWHDICATARPDDWLSVEDMRRHLAGNDKAVLGDYLPVFDASTQDPIPVADAWYVPRLRRCYRKSTLLEWTATFRVQGDNPAKKLWPDDGLRNELSLAELFALGADPFNDAMWRPSLPNRSARLPADRIAALIDTDRLLTAVRTDATMTQLGVLPPDNDVFVVGEHAGLVLAVAWSPDGTRIASASADDTIAIWNADETRQARATLADHDDDVTAVAFAAPAFLISGSADGTFRWWNLDAFVVMESVWHIDSAIQAVQVSANGAYMAVGTRGGEVFIWDARERQHLHQVAVAAAAPASSILSLAFSADGELLVAGLDNGTLAKIQPASGTIVAVADVLHGHQAAISALAFLPDALAVAADAMLYVVDANTGLEIRDFPGHTAAIVGIAVSPDGMLLASASRDFTVRLWRIETGQEIARQTTVARPSSSIAFSPPQQQRDARLAFGTADGLVRVWPVDDVQQQPVPHRDDDVRFLAGHDEDVEYVAYSPDGRYLASAQFAGHTFIWDVDAGLPVRELFDPVTGLPLAGVTDLAWSPDGSLVATAHSGTPGYVRVWHAASGAIERSFQDFEAAMFAVQFSPNGTYFAAGTANGHVTIWTVAPWQKYRDIAAFDTAAVMKLAFSPDGRSIAGKSDDSGIAVWDVATGARTMAMDDDIMHNNNDFVFYAAAAAGSNQRRIAYSGNDGRIHVIDTGDGREIRQIGDHEPDLEYASNIAVSPNGMLLASSEDGLVHIWHANTGIELHRLTDQRNHGFLSIAFSPDGRAVAFGATDNVVRIWKFASGGVHGGVHGGVPPPAPLHVAQ